MVAGPVATKAARRSREAERISYHGSESRTERGRDRPTKFVVVNENFFKDWLAKHLRGQRARDAVVFGPDYLQLRRVPDSGQRP